METTAAPVSPYSGGASVALSVTDERELNHWWGIPVFGMMARAFMAIPHFVVLNLMGIGLAIWAIIGWIWILAFGRVPALAVKFLIEYVHRSSRIAGYILLMPGGYPPLEPGAPIPVNVDIYLESLQINRWWGIPIFGWLVRILVLIPQFIVLSFLIVGVVLSLLVLWIPVLLYGRYPDWAASFYGTVLRYGVRLQAYLLFLPVPYPPFWPH